MTRFSPKRAVLTRAKSSVKGLSFSPNALVSRISKKRPPTSRLPQGAAHTGRHFSDNTSRVRALHAKTPDREGHLSPSQLHQLSLTVEHVLYTFLFHNAIVVITYFFKCAETPCTRTSKPFPQKDLRISAQKPRFLQNKHLSAIIKKAVDYCGKGGKTSLSLKTLCIISLVAS